ncbi:MAG: hypothetical protein J6Z47_00865 [Bacteroidales bacterium]|nr:hypothetical protein [Bacteroidales bacterium]
MKILKISSRFLCAIVIASSALAAVSCDKDDNFGIDANEQGIKGGDHGDRKEFVQTRKVLLFYECGFNSLYSYIKEDMERELVKGFIPRNGRNDDILLVFSRLARNGNYVNQPSYLRRLYTDAEGTMVSDTLLTLPAETIASSPETMRSVLNYAKSAFPSKGYGLIFASHGSGWLPATYYSDPSAYEKEHSAPGGKAKSAPSFPRAPIPSGSLEETDPYFGMTRSIGNDAEKVESGPGSPYIAQHEMSIGEFVSGIPFHLDYVLFDMCFSAGAELYYGLKDVADFVMGSPCEVMADGMFDYTTVTSYLIGRETPDLEGLADDSFKRYDSRTGVERSAVVSLSKSAGMEALAATCKSLFETYRAALSFLDYTKVQGYYRSGRHYFFDLEDVFVKCGASQADLALLKNALDGCILYKNATPSFLGYSSPNSSGFTIDTTCGVSIYLPCAGTPLLDSLYKLEAWNSAVSLVK